MQTIGYLIHLLATGLGAIGSFARLLSSLLHGLLPVLLPPEQLTRLMRSCYRNTYAKDLSARTLKVEKQDLALWEADLLDRYDIHAGRMLVLGSGYGREAIPTAQRGLAVIGIDSNDVAVRIASRLARQSGTQAQFHRADYFHLPYRPASFDYALLSSIMYSAIPGMSLRQAYLRSLSDVVTPRGLVILNFETRQTPRSNLSILRSRVQLALARLPGANAGYQIGDNCQNGHFLHEFQSEAEIQEEFARAGLTVLELNWPRGFAVLTRHIPDSQAVAQPAQKLTTRHE